MLHVSENNYRNSWSTEILRTFLSFSDNLLPDVYIILQKKKKKRKEKEKEKGANMLALTWFLVQFPLKPNVLQT